MVKPKTDCMCATNTTRTHTHSSNLSRREAIQATIPLIKLFTIFSLTLTHLGTFLPLLRQNVKLHEIRGSSGTKAFIHKDTPSLNISFPYAKAGSGRIRAFLLTLSFSLDVPAPAEWFCAMTEGRKRNTVREGVLWV